MMPWETVSQVATGNALLDSLWIQFGSLGLLIALLIVIVITQQKKIERLESRLEQSNKDRLTDAQQFAALNRKPLDELVNFVRTLYDLSNKNKDI